MITVTHPGADQCSCCKHRVLHDVEPCQTINIFALYRYQDVEAYSIVWSDHGLVLNFIFLLYVGHAPVCYDGPNGSFFYFDTNSEFRIPNSEFRILNSEF